MTTDHALRITGLEKAFGDRPVLRGVDLDVERGTVLALLGANGAGKTTLVSILATLVRADGGTVVVAGHDLATDPAGVRAAISLTGQFTAVDDVLTGRENLVLVARLRRVPRPREAAEGLLTRFDLTDAADRRAGTYSGGMRRRLDLAMSLVTTPAVLVLDEPTTGLDPQSRLDVWSTVEAVAAAGTTVLLTTQHLEEAERLADRVAILHEGRILVCDTVDGLRRRLPPARVEYVERRPTLEDVFLTLVARDRAHT